MMESNHEGPVVTVVEAPEEMFVDEVLRNDYDYLELEPRMASPERSYVDEDQFVMASNYLKSQFSVPHHLVPSYQDISQSSLMKRRLSHLPNIENHRFDPNISPYDVPKIDEFEKRPEVYKNVNIYKMEKKQGSARRPTKHQRVNKIERRVGGPQRRNFQVQKNEKSNSGFLSNLLTPWNPFRKSERPPQPARGPPPPPREFGPIPDRFKYPLPTAHKRVNDGFRPMDQKKMRNMHQPAPGSSRPQPGEAKRPAPHRRQGPEDYKFRRRSSLKYAENRNRNSDVEKKIDGLPVDFGLDEAIGGKTSKPDYKNRWRNLTRDHESMNKKLDRIDVIEENNDDITDDPVTGDRKISPVFNDWGDTFWDEIHDDWGEEDEDKFADLSARYLNAWADVARIGSKKKNSQQSSIPDNIKPDPSDFETKVDLLENEAPSDNETKRINRSQIKNRRRPIQTSRLFRS